MRPTVQGAAVVLENKTGRILAMVGGFSYPMSQLNRVTQSRRQPGSSFKPMTYLAALNSGLQPNTLVDDAPVTYPPIGGVNRYTRDTDYWSPQQLRRRLFRHDDDAARAGDVEEPGDRAPARRRHRRRRRAQSLDEICKLAIEAHVYPKCERYYPFVLGAQPVRPIDLAAFYAAIANEGKRPTPHVIESITQDGRDVYKADEALTPLAGVDPAGGVPAPHASCKAWWRAAPRRASSALSPYVGGKTGTSDEFNDAWFVGFSNDVTIAVWVGYDNAKGKRTLGNGQAGGKVALPIFEPIMQGGLGERRAADAAAAALARGGAPSGRAADRRAVRPARSTAAAAAITASTFRDGGNSRASISGGFMEYFRLDDSGRLNDTQDRLASRGGLRRRLRRTIRSRASSPGSAARPVRQSVAAAAFGSRAATTTDADRRRATTNAPTQAGDYRAAARCSTAGRSRSGRSGIMAGRSRLLTAAAIHIHSPGSRMSRLKLSIATTDYDHFRDFRLGAVQAEGIDTPGRCSAITRFSRASPSIANGTRPSCRSPSSPPR